MKRITVSVGDQIYQRARLKAAALDTSVSALVKEFLVQLTAEETDSERGKGLQREVIATITAFSAGDRLNREQAHERA